VSDAATPGKGLSPAQRKLRARFAAEKSWANTSDRTARTAPARQALYERFVREVDPEGTLPLEERTRRAEHAQRAYQLGLAWKGQQALRAKRAQRK
jgi:hypothetical protein